MSAHRVSRIGWIAAFAVACAAPTPAERMAGWRESAVSPALWEVVRPHLEDLKPGDDLGLLVGAREVHARERANKAPVVVIPSWISSLSGGSAGGLSMFGQLVGRSGDRVHGSHVFGTVVLDRIEPRYQIFTEARLVEREEYDRLALAHVAGIGAIPRPTGILFFRDLLMAGGRPLAFGELSERQLSQPAKDAVLRSKEAYSAVEPIVEGLPRGTDLMSLLAALDSEFLTNDFGESHSLRARGFLHTGKVRTRTLEISQGLYKLRPFGWLDGEREVVEQIAIFENDRLLGVVAHRGLDDWTTYLHEL